MTKNRGDWALRSRTQRPTYLAHGNSSPHWRCRSCPLARSRTRSKKGFRHNTNHATPRLEKAGRAAFVDAIEHALSGNKRLRQAAAAIVFELEDFRKIKELHDCDAGETLLDATRDRVSELLIEGDEILRLDGPRFGIALSPLRRLDLEGAIQLATRIQHTMADPVQLQGCHLYITVSVSFALASRLDCPTPADLVRAASVAQFEAVRDGANAIRSYSNAMHQRMVTHNGLFDEVQKALES